MSAGAEKKSGPDSEAGDGGGVHGGSRAVEIASNLVKQNEDKGAYSVPTVDHREGPAGDGASVQKEVVPTAIVHMNASEKANKKADCEPVKQTDPAATAHVTSHQTEMARDAVEESDKEAYIVQTVDHRVEPAGKNNPERLVDSLTAVVHENAD